MNMTRPLGIESANAPTNAASATYEMVKKNLSSGTIHAGPLQLGEQLDRGDEQRVVGERREELRRHDGVETALHRSVGSAGDSVGLRLAGSGSGRGRRAATGRLAQQALLLGERGHARTRRGDHAA